MKLPCLVASAVAVACLATSLVSAQRGPATPAIELWAQGKVAFGVFVPNENAPQRPPAAGAQGQSSAGPRPTPLYTAAGAAKLAANALYDFVFLNLEGSYDGAAVKAVSEGLRSAAAGAPKTLIVRIPAYHDDAAAAHGRVREIIAAGAEGVTFPHVQSADEARRIIEIFQQEKINVWSAGNPSGDKLAMLMIEDPDALAQTLEFANLKGYSILACGIGSLTQAFKGDRTKAEAGTQMILAATKRAKLVNMLTATMQDVEKRVKEGFLAILAQGQNADEAIKMGRVAAGR